MFQLTSEEVAWMRSQIVTASKRNIRFQPYVFTEHGVVMAASLLNSPRAVEVSVFVVRAFVKLRQLVLAHKDLADKLDQLERKVGSRDEAIKQLVAAIRQLMAPPDPPKIQMGFHAIRDSAKEKAEPPKPTASAKPPRHRRHTDARTTRQPTALRGPCADREARAVQGASWSDDS
ncbi:MAG: ORF6N domain-containing protein [Planctomycetota bacterium]|nr:ORF6N domain-containing protein [Planctomycetota bacterium]